MKRIARFAALFAVLFLTVSASYGEGPNALTLDGAIKEASDFVAKRVESGTKVALFNFKSSSDRFSEYVLSELEANFMDRGAFTMVSRADAENARKEIGIRISGDAADDALRAAGQKLGAKIVISGHLVETGETHRIVVRIIDTQDAQSPVVAQYRGDISNDSRVNTLLRGSSRTASAPRTTGGGGGSGGGGTARAGGNTAPAGPPPETGDWWAELNADAGYRLISGQYFSSSFHGFHAKAGGSVFYPVNHIAAIGAGAGLGYDRYSIEMSYSGIIVAKYSYSTFSLYLEPKVRAGYPEMYGEAYLPINIPISAKVTYGSESESVSSAPTSVRFGLGGRYLNFGAKLEFIDYTTLKAFYFWQAGEKIEVVPGLGLNSVTGYTEYIFFVGMNYLF